MSTKKLSRFIIISALLFSVSAAVLSQDIPGRPVPPRLVNDFAGMLRPQEAAYLERKLVAFNDSTSTQIAIVIVRSLDGYAISDYAQRLGENWGIGQKGRDNGILILIKPKTGTGRGEVFIAQGYGLEGAIPDLVADDIVENEILPAFRNGEYLGGLDRATTTLMSLASGEYSADEYNARKGSGSQGDSGISLFAVIVIVLIIFAIFRGKSGGSNSRHLSSGNLPLWILLGMMNSGRGSHGGSWGGFSGGGRGGGGFGGFGGGSFGGGGAGGSW